MSHLIILGVASFLISFIGLGFMRRWSPVMMPLDFPNARSSHKRPTPRGGGLVIYLVTVIGSSIVLSTTPYEHPQVASALVLSGSVVAFVGWIDDRRPLRPVIRLLAQIIAAFITIALLGGISRLGLPDSAPLSTGHFATPLTVLWIVGLINSYNFMDGIDGIAGLQAMIGGLTIAAIAFAQGQLAISVVSLLLSGASSGFLIHNWNPAKVFMGDVGSGFIGYVFALLALVDFSSSYSPLPYVCLTLAPFLFDTIVTFLRRLSRGEDVFSAHRTHLYQRLVSSGLSHAQVTTIYGAISATGGVLSFLIDRGRIQPVPSALTFLVAASAFLTGTTVFFEKRSAATLKGKTKHEM